MATQLQINEVAEVSALLRLSLVSGICLSLLLASGCGEARPDLFPVSGQVLFRGQPAAGALVVFHDRRPPVELQDLPIPRATTDSTGRFALSTFQREDGAPTGQYRVAILLNKAIGRVPGKSPTIAEMEASEGEFTASDPEAVRRGPVVEGAQYADPESSGLTVTVAEQENVLPPFNLN